MSLPKIFPRSTRQYRALQPLRCLAAVLIVVGLANANAAAQEVSGTFVSIEVPGASLTSARAITADGRIVGNFVDASGQHGFLLADGRFTSIDAPVAGARSTIAFGINNRGDVVGAWVDSAGVAHGYLWPANGTFTSIDVPGAIRTLARGINAAGDVVGVYDNPDKRRAFLLSRKGVLTLIDLPFTLGPPVSGTWATSINNRGDIVGPGFDGSIHGYLISGETVTQLDVPFAGATDTLAYGLNARGDIVGHYTVAARMLGFLRDRHGNYESIEAPSAVNTLAYGISAAGDIVGQYASAGVTRGFVLYRSPKP